MTSKKFVTALALGVVTVGLTPAAAHADNVPAAPPVERVIKAPNTQESMDAFIAPWTQCVNGHRELSIVSGANPSTYKGFENFSSVLNPATYLPLQSTMTYNWKNLTTGKSGSTTVQTGHFETMAEQLVGPGRVQFSVVKKTGIGMSGSSIPGTDVTMRGNWDVTLAGC